MINYDLVSKSRVSIKEVFEQEIHCHRHRNVTATNVSNYEVCGVEQSMKQRH